MNNSEVVRNFVKGENKGKGSHLFIEGDVIYSYGYHFPIALRLLNNNGYKFIFNTDRYSVSTSRHKSKIKDLIQDNIIILCNTQKLKEIINRNIKEVKQLVAEEL